MEYYFDRDDRLERLKYAEFLKTLLINCDKYRREDSDGAYVIALDSPWGTGKTRFVKMLRNYLEGNKPRIINGKVDRAYTPKLNEDRLFNVVYYNAWDTDFSTDALEPLFYSLLKSPEIAPDQFDAAGNEILEKFENATKEMLKAAGYALSHFVLGEAATTVLKSGIDAICTKQPNPYENYEKRLELISNFRKALTAVIDATKQKKFVIIIDELDRCRPTFAIETLEIAKHLFMVPGLVFIFALDIEQLSHSIRTVYGKEMRASGYLCRFFEYIGKLPIPDRETYICEILGKQEFYKMSPEDFAKNNAFYISEKSRILDIGLRDINTILNTYQIMCKTFLERYLDYKEHQIYLFLLMIKYKEQEYYASLISDDEFIASCDIFKKRVITIVDPLAKQIARIKNRKLIRNLSYYMYHNGNKIIDQPIEICSIEYSSDSSTGVLMTYYTLTQGGKATNRIGLDKGVSLDDLLYFSDLLEWERIKDLTLAQYYHRQLEMFDFVLPADEAKVEG